MVSRSWPVRFEVLVLQDGAEKTFGVATWLDREKATAMVLDHVGADAEVLTVREVGPVDRGPDGVATPARSDLVDRMEW